MTLMSIAFGMDGTRMSRGIIIRTMAESKKSEVRILFATMGIFAGRLRFPPTQMQIVLHFRGTLLDEPRKCQEGCGVHFWHFEEAMEGVERWILLL